MKSLVERSLNMGKEFKKGPNLKSGSMPQSPNMQNIKPGTMKEEISVELAELGNLKPKQEPMTPNQRKKSEEERTY